MKSFFKFLLICFIIYVCLAVTNPNMNDYKAYITNRINNGSDNILVNIGANFVGNNVGNFVSVDDKKILTIYTLKNPFGNDYKTIGILKMFF